MAERDPDGHVNYATFGLSKLADRRPFYDLITKAKPNLDSHTTKLLWREVYETHFGIFNHDDPKLQKEHPLALVELHPKEDTFSYSLAHRLMWKFRQYKIKEQWGYNYTQFLELPWYYVQQIFQIEQRIATEQMRRDEEIRRQEEAKQRDEQRNMTQPGLTPIHRYVPTNPRGGR